jgi:hypothetical protein
MRRFLRAEMKEFLLWHVVQAAVSRLKAERSFVLNVGRQFQEHMPLRLPVRLLHQPQLPQRL